MNIFRKLFDWYFNSRTLPYWCILLIDCAIVAFSMACGILADNSWTIAGGQFSQFCLGILIALIPFVVAFRLLHTYSGIIRYSTFTDLTRVAAADGGASLVLLSVTLIVSWLAPEQNFILLPGIKGCLITFGSSTLLMWLERVIVKRMFDTFNIDRATPVAIYGTKSGGVSIAQSINSVREKKYRLVAFISDGAEMKDAYLMGKKVYLNGPNIVKTLEHLGVKMLLVSPLKEEKLRSNDKFIDELIAAGIKILMMGGGEEWDGKSQLNHNQLHEVSVEDLLPRDKIEVDMDDIGALLRCKRILITGAAGSIGSELVRQIAKYKPAEMVLIDQAETPMHDIRLMMAKQYPDIANSTIVTSITNRRHMEKIFFEHRPEYVFHAAAYKHVPMMEDDPAIAVQNNIYGTKVIADLAVEYGTRKFVMISTDKAVNPTNVMGCSKRICEIYCQSLNQAIQEGKVVGATQFVTTRFGNVLGSNGSVIPIFKDQIAKGGPVTVTHPDIIRYFMLIPEACQLVLEAGTMGNGGEIFVFDMGKPVKIVDLAKRMIALSGAKDVKIQFSGLRDGEKLYEEVLNDKEGTLPTDNPKIRIAKVRSYDYETACNNEERLLKISQNFDDMAIVKVMKEIVPEYKSRHSKYEALDKEDEK